MTTIALLLLLVLLPLPRHWPLLRVEYPGVYYGLTSFDFYLSDVAVVALLLTAVPFIYRQSSSSIPKNVIAPMVWLAAATAVSSLNAFDLVLALGQTLRLILLLAVALVIMRARPRPRWAQIGLAATLTAQAVAALLQFSLQDDLGLRWLGEIDLNRYPGGGSILFAGGRYWLRGYGLTPHPNILGGVLATFLLALVVPFLQARPRAKPVWLAVWLLGTAALLITFSRSAWLGGLVGGLFLAGGLAVNGKWRRRYGRSLLILLITGGLAMGGLVWSQRSLIQSRFVPAGNAFETRSVDERAALTAAGWQLFRLNPMTGIGAGNTAVAIAPLVKDVAGVGPQPVHSAPLLLAIELGAPGAALWLWLALFPIGLALHRWRQDRLSLWAWGLTAVLVALAVIDLFDYYVWGWQQGRLLHWTAWGLWGAAIANPQPATQCH